MTNIKSSILLTLIVILLSACDSKNGNFVCHFGVPGGDEYEIAGVVSDFIEKNYGDFADRKVVEKTHKGKIYYSAPGCIPHYIFYEITKPDDVRRIEIIARAALKNVPIDTIELTFYEKQNFSENAQGGGSRLSENKITSITISKSM